MCTLTCGLIIKIPSVARLSRNPNWELRLNQGLTHEWQGYDHLNHFFLPSLDEQLSSS